MAHATPNIPTWPGSSSFAAVSASFYSASIGPRPTGFGYYDGDPTFVAAADRVADWCARNLGYPSVDVELVDVSFYTAFEEAVTEFSTWVNMYNAKDNITMLIGSSISNDVSQRVITPNLQRLVKIAESYGSEAGVGGTVDYKKGYIETVANQATYDLDQVWAQAYESGSKIEIKRVFHGEVPAISRFFDPQVGTGGGSQAMLDSFGWGAYSPAVSFLVMPIYADLLRMQAIEFNDQIRKSTYSFLLRNNKLTLTPTPTSEIKVWFDYIVEADRMDPFRTPAGTVSDLSNVPYGRITYGTIRDVGVRWIQRYTLAICKVMLGTMVRAKYSTIPIPESETTLNGSELGTQGREDMVTLVTELKELLQSMTRQGQAEQETAIATAMQSQLNKVPLYIYIK